MTHYLVLAMHTDHLQKMRRLSLAAWMGTRMFIERDNDIDREDLILERKTIAEMRALYNLKPPFDAHDRQFVRLSVPIGVTGESILLPILMASWAINAKVLRHFQQAFPTLSFHNLFYWLIPLNGNPVQTNHPTITGSTPHEIKQKLIDAARP